MDVLSTMSDPSLPLTATEYDEWGNPSADRVSRGGVVLVEDGRSGGSVGGGAGVRQHASGATPQPPL